MILLICMTLVAFSMSNSMLFEQKTSANQYRSTKAFEAAEAGIEWATAMLNDVHYINTSCTAVTSGSTQSFREKYLPYNATGFSPVSTAQPGCSISTASGLPVLSCSCPDAGDNPSLNSTTNPTFTVKFEPVNAMTSPNATSSNQSVLVTAYGCTSADVRCVPGATSSADAYQMISVILKLRPALAAVPGAAISTGGSLIWGSSASEIINTDPSSNGVLVNAGGTCCGSKNYTATTLPGSPIENAIVTGDSSLSALSSSQDAMFEAFFGTTVAQFKADTNTKVLTAAICGSNCEAAFLAAYAGADGTAYRAFYLEADMHVSSGTIGTQAKPVILATSANLRFNGGTEVWGLIYADTAVSWEPTGNGKGSLHGALVTRGSFSPNANVDYIYDADVLGQLRPSTGTLMRVPGSWKDF
jgi:Tfp pilus assembly protein PilX